jgi:peptidoglycan biosynthesis protein MviN/MurJ (putative lipid II flippase)
MTLMGLLLWRGLGHALRGHGLGALLLRVLFASAVMGIVMWFALGAVAAWLGDVGFVPHLLAVLACGLAGAPAYLLAANALGVDELRLRRLARRR